MAMSKEEQYRRRILGAVETVRNWKTNPWLISDICAAIPKSVKEEDANKHDGKYSRPEDAQLCHPDARILQRLARYFQKDVMTWVNNPPCEHCHSKATECQEMQQHAAPKDDITSKTKPIRVEVYKCADCSGTTTFPRHNDPLKIFQNKRGRCGEYANLFGVYVLACLPHCPVRYVLDWTDHVWTEVYIDNQWIMADSCEGTIGEPSMYEAGWGKKLNMIVAVGFDHVQDVSAKYTRQWNQTEYQERRRTITTSEPEGTVVIETINMTLLQQPSLEPAQIVAVATRMEEEKEYLDYCKKEEKWIDGYKQGRVSGSLDWKVARGEAGQLNNNK